MRIRLELPMLVTEEVIRDGDGRETARYTVREPDTFGARCKWGQVADNGGTMLVEADIDEAELEKIPAEHRR